MPISIHHKAIYQIEEARGGLNYLYHIDICQMTEYENTSCTAKRRGILNSKFVPFIFEITKDFISENETDPGLWSYKIL